MKLILLKHEFVIRLFLNVFEIVHCQLVYIVTHSAN